MQRKITSDLMNSLIYKLSDDWQSGFHTYVTVCFVGFVCVFTQAGMQRLGLRDMMNPLRHTHMYEPSVFTQRPLLQSFVSSSSHSFTSMGMNNKYNE